MNAKRFLTTALLLTLWTGSALAWETPCIDEPYGWRYEDERRSVVIRQESENDVTWFVADVQIAQAEVWQSAVSTGMEPLTALVAGTDAVLAINGDDYGTHNHGVILRNGQLLRQRDTTRHMLVVAGDGSLSLVTDRKSNAPRALAERLASEQAWQAYEFGPALVEGGEALPFPGSFDLISTRASRREPRTAIGEIAPLHYCVMVVDGRQPGYSEGISLQGLQQLLLRYGVQTAFNLDGGGSSEMWFMGEILNRPSGGHERKMSDAICF